MSEPLRLMAVLAHPDDESLSMGGTLARYAAAGEQVAVVTATRGEAGEILNHDDPESLRESLGEVREAELRAACALLGVSAVELLGYRDSGMAGTPDNGHPDAFCRADFMEAVGRLVRVIRRHRPEVVTAYDPFGGYGHPDHIQVHRVGTAAFYGSADTGRFPPQRGEKPWQPATPARNGTPIPARPGARWRPRCVRLPKPPPQPPRAASSTGR